MELAASAIAALTALGRGAVLTIRAMALGGIAALAVLELVLDARVR